MTNLLHVPRSEIEQYENRGVLEDRFMQLQREARALESSHGAHLAKRTSWANWQNYVIAPAIGISLGEGINYGLGLWGKSGKYGGAFIERHMGLFTSVPHAVLGTGLAVATIPTDSSSLLRDGVFAGAAGLATVGFVRLGGVVSDWIRGRASNRAELEAQLADLQQKNAQATAQLQQQNVQIQALNAQAQARGGQKPGQKNAQA